MSQGIGTHPEPGKPSIMGDRVQGQEQELRLTKFGVSRPRHRVIPGERWAVTWGPDSFGQCSAWPLGRALLSSPPGLYYKVVTEEKYEGSAAVRLKGNF